MTTILSTKNQGAASHGFQETIASGQNGTAVYVPDNISVVSVGLVPAGGATGKVQYTLSGAEAVEAGTATWRDWAKGNVTATADDVLLGPVTAIRGVSVSGNVTVEMVG